MENDPTTIARVFSKPPPHTPEELTLIIEEFRTKRAQYLSGAKPVKVKATGQKINLSELEL